MDLIIGLLHGQSILNFNQTILVGTSSYSVLVAKEDWNILPLKKNYLSIVEQIEKHLVDILIQRQHTEYNGFHAEESSDTLY